MRRRLPLFAALFVGLAVAVTGLVLLRRALDRNNTWPSVEASIVRCFADEQHNDNNTYFAVRYDFDYPFGGQTHHAQFVSPVTYSRIGADRMLARHVVGSLAVIRVNPANPDQVDPNLGRNAASLAGPLWLMLTGVAIALLAPPLWLLFTAPDAW